MTPNTETQMDGIGGAADSGEEYLRERWPCDHPKTTASDLMDTDLGEMCPNCNTPWKCNGPHLNIGDCIDREHGEPWADTCPGYSKDAINSIVRENRELVEALERINSGVRHPMRIVHDALTALTRKETP